MLTDVETDIRSAIRHGAINFDAVVAELRANGFIDDRHEEMTLTRPGFNQFDPQEFRTLFEFFFPGTQLTMDIHAHGVEMGPPGDIVWVLYDINSLSPSEVAEAVKEKYSTRTPQ